MISRGALVVVQSNAPRRPASANLNRGKLGIDVGPPGERPERLVLPKTAPDRPFRQTFNASPDAVSEGPSTSSFPSGLVDPVSQARLALLSGLFPVPPETLGAMLAAEPKLRDSPIATISASLMELRRRLPNSNLETILTYAPQILFQDPDTVAAALKMLRAFLPEPLIEFLVLEEQAILAGGLTPRRLNELRESWDTYGARLPRQDPACASRNAFEEFKGKDDLLREELRSSRLAQYVRHTIVDFYH